MPHTQADISMFTIATRRLRTKIFLIILIAGLPVMGMAVYQVYLKYRTDYQEAEHAIKVTADAIAYQHAAQVEGIRNLLNALAQFPEVKKRDSNASTLLLHNILKQNPASYNIGIADINGNLIASGVNAKFTIGDRKYFKDAVRTKRFSVGEYTLSRAVGKAAIHFAQPVLNEGGDVTAVIYVTFDLNSFNSIFDAQKLPPDSALNITDHQGILLHRYPSHPTVKPGLADRPDLRAHMTGTLDEGVFNDFGRDNVKRLLAFKRIRLHPDEAPYLYLRVSIPEKQALASVHRLVITSLFFFAGAWLLAMLLSRLLARRYLVAPLERISEVAQAARQGVFTVRTNLTAGKDEISQLALSIDTMTESLENQRIERELSDAERQQMEAVLRESERRFRELLESVHLVAVILDQSANIVFCNDFLLELTGWSRHEVLGKNWFELFISEEEGDQIQAVFAEAMKTGDMLSHFENNIITKDRRQRVIVWDNTLLRDGSAVTGTASIGIDITNHRSMEEQLLQSQKMEAIGQLAGGVAHDFNNLLTPIIGYAELIRNEVSSCGGKIERIDRIVEAAYKARDLTRQLLSFGRKQNLDMKHLDLNEVVTGFVRILRRTIREDIAIKTGLHDQPLIINADKTQLDQIIMNLAVNAQDAIQGNGVISIETGLILLDTGYTEQHRDLEPGEYVVLMVSDTGHGIDKQVQKHIFEPFFTTKAVDKGTGLGLATVYGIVKQHNGSIYLYSEPGNGTTFKIFLPRCHDELALEPTQAEQSKALPHASGRILLVEDNEFVRELARDLLESAGYHVIVAEDATQAITLATAAEIDLLVSDVVMPGMSGPELFVTLARQFPGLKVLFMSGYTNAMISQQIETIPEAAFIQKPFAVDTMLMKVAKQMMHTPEKHPDVM
jgi:PAS domain S-box-containing protein